MQNALWKFTKLFQLELNKSFLKKREHVFVQYPVRNVCARFKVDRSSNFCIRAHQILTTQKPFSCEPPLP